MSTEPLVTDATHQFSGYSLKLGHVAKAKRPGFFEPVGDDSQGQGLNARNGFVPVLAVAHHTAQERHFCGPASVVFGFELYGECHELNLASWQGV
jgi:hypothetical protein